MPITIGEGLAFCGRALTQEELALIRQVTREYPNLALTELAATVCELLAWQRPNGGLKTRECYLFLRELHTRGWLPWLPAPQPRLRRVRELDPVTESIAAPAVLSGPLQTYRPLRLQLLETPADYRLFRGYLSDYHYLGYRAPYGAQLRYLVRAAQPDLPPLAALLFTSAAWHMAPRDRYIGWTDAVRQSNLPQVVNHSRFLILPWARIPHLASHVLAQAAHQLSRDWQVRYGVEPLLLETLVDPHYRGVCYRAANWVQVGMTQGRGRMDREHLSPVAAKQIFLYPLHRHWRQRLCAGDREFVRRENEPAGNL